MSRSRMALGAHIVWKLGVWTIKSAMLALMVATPLLGVWVSSSLAVFANEGLYLSIIAALLMFPLAPLVWELWAASRRRKKQKSGERFFTFSDRMIMRTLVINGLFLAGLLAWWPKTAFTALSAHGDWVLGEAQGPAAEKTRRVLFAAAERLEWLYALTKENPYDRYEKKRGKRPPAPSSQPSARGDARGRDVVPPPRRQGRWPESATLHSLVEHAPAPSTTTARALGRHFAAHTPLSRDRVRAIHDYVAHHIAYDAVALAQGRYPPQDPGTVLRTGLAVCAGYAKLFEAIAEAADLEAFYVVGQARQRDGGIDGDGHAWNAVKLDGQWYLLDVTWDAGTVNNGRFSRNLRTVYFMTPPEVFVADHFPRDANWQLLEEKLTRGEFIRQPLMRPSFYAAGLRLISPRRSIVSVERDLTIRLANPRGYHFVASFKLRESQRDVGRCKAKPGKEAELTCRFPSAGKYAVSVCINEKRFGTFRCVGRMLVNATD